MPRHVEYHPYAAKPVQSRPGAGARETATAGKPFAALLAEAEAVRDPVHIRAPAAAPGSRNAMSAGGLVAAATGLWHGLGGLGLHSRARKEAAAAGAGEPDIGQGGE